MPDLHRAEAEIGFKVTGHVGVIHASSLGLSGTGLVYTTRRRLKKKNKQANIK